MTREEAIAILEVSKHMATSGRLYNQAIDMAIEALQREEAEEKGYCHRIKPKEYFSADAESVVRCKDCRHRDLFSCPLADNDFQKDDDYCSWGERREP